jgi:hypothetical protein
MKKIIFAGILSLFVVAPQFSVVAASQVAPSHAAVQTRFDPPIPDPNCTTPPGQACKPARP